MVKPHPEQRRTDQVLQERTHRRALQEQPGRRELLQKAAAG